LNKSNKVFYLIIGSLINSLFLLFFTLISYFFFDKVEFSFLTGLFIFENILIFFDLSINNHIIKYLSSKKNIIKKKIINFFLKKILIFFAIFFLFNIFILKEIFWNIVINLDNKSTLFIVILVSLIIIIRISINFFRAILIGNSDQIVTAKIQIVSSSLKFLILGFFLFFHKSIEGLLIIYLLCFFIEFLLYLRSVYRKYIINFNVFKKYTIDKNYTSSFLKFFLLSVSIIIFYNIDRIFLSYSNDKTSLGEYNFFRTISLGFFILSSAYYFSLLPEISRNIKSSFFIKQKIIKNFKSLNLILIFCIIASVLFLEKFFYDFKIHLLFNIENFLVFKIIILATYFNMLGQIFLSFQIANIYLKIPTIINSIIIILFLFFMKPLFSLYNFEGIAYMYLLMNFFSLVLNIIFLPYLNRKIFGNNFSYIIFKIILFDFIISFLILIIVDTAFYSLSKLTFYFVLTFVLFYVFYLSQRFLKS
jgi:O-antigen/teichoic acid export membrane protein